MTSDEKKMLLAIHGFGAYTWQFSAQRSDNLRIKRQQHDIEKLLRFRAIANSLWDINTSNRLREYSPIEWPDLSDLPVELMMKFIEEN